MSYASELARWGIETSIIVPGAFTSGTNHFKNAGSPNDKPGAVEYDSGPHHGFADLVQKGLAATTPPDTDVTAVADAIVKVIDMPFGKRPFRTHVDPAQDGCEVTDAVREFATSTKSRLLPAFDCLVNALLEENITRIIFSN